MRTFKPLGDRLLVLPDAPVAENTKGLAKPPSQKEAPTEGIVVAVGPLAIKGYQIDSVAIGDRVQYTKYAGRDVMHNGVEHKLLRLEEVQGIIEDDGQ